MTIGFQFKPSKSHRGGVILVQVSEGRGCQWKYSLQLHLENAQHWNPVARRVRTAANVPHQRLNQRLDQFNVAIRAAYTKAITEGVVRDKDFYKAVIDGLVKDGSSKSSSAEPETLKRAFELAIEHYTTQRNEHTGELTKASTLQTYVGTLSHLEKIGLAESDVAVMDLAWYNRFISLSESGNRRQKPLAKNTIGKHTKNIKRILTFAKGLHWSVHPAFLERGFKVQQEFNPQIALSEQEIGQIIDLDLSGSSRSLNVSRDLFVIGCYTGLRFSDLQRLSKENIENAGGLTCFRVTSLKTQFESLIPIHPKVQAILDRYRGYPPPRQVEQLTNRNLKRISQMAGLDRPHKVERTIGGQRLMTERPLYEVLSTHDARRSFCTNAYLSGMDTLDIMAISGHKTEKSFMRYIQIVPLQRAKRIAEHAFFNG